MEFNSDEQSGLEAIEAAGANATDKLSAITLRQVRSARGSIVAGGNPLGPEGYVPDQVIPDVIAIVRWKWLVSFPELKKQQTKDRKDAHDEAVKLFRDIAKGEIKVEIPDTRVDVAGPKGQVEVANVAPRRASSKLLDGMT